MQKSVIRVFWPRAESHVYSEPRKLVAAGFASEREERAKGRQRTVYAITAEGRKALTEWLQAPATSELRTQSEFMLRFILSDSGPGQLPSALLDTALEASNSELAEAGAGILAILKNPGLALEGMPWNGLAINLMVDIMLARHAWLVDLRGSVPAQPMSQEDQRAAGMAAYEEALQKLRPLVPGIETGGILGTVYLIDDCD